MLNTTLKKVKTEWLSASIIKTLPIFLATNLVAIVIWQLQISQFAMPLVLGIIAGGLVDLDNSFAGRLHNLLFSTLAFALSSLSSQLALGMGWFFVPVATLLTFIVVMLGAIGQRYSTIAFGSLVVAVYTTLTYDPNANWYSNTLMILAGSLIYGLVGMAVHLVFPNRTAQDNLAKAYDALGAYLWAKSAYFDPDDDDLSAKQLALAKANSAVMQCFDQTRVSLFYRLQGHNRRTRTHRMLKYYFTAQDILERASSSHYRYQELFTDLQNSDLMFRFQRVLELQATACQAMATALRHNERYQHSPRGEKALQGLLKSLHYHQQQGLANSYRWQSIAENLRQIEAQFQPLAQTELATTFDKNLLKSTRLIAENISGGRNMLNAIKGNFNLSSQLFRHAIRLSIVVAVCSSLVQLFQLDNKGYWILLTAIFVCQPNYAATKSRLIQRVIGTVLGVVVGLSLHYLSPSLEAYLGLLVLTGSLYTFFRFSHYGFSTFYITLLVLVSLNIIGQGAENAMLPRLVDTLTGTFIAWLAVSYIYPDWKYLNLHKNLINTLNSCVNYLRHIIAQLQFGYNEQLPYRTARREIHQHLSALSTAISNMHSEPQKYRQALQFAPNLLGVTYTLLGYISALGAYRQESHWLNQQVQFSVGFFATAKQIIHLMERIIQQPNQEQQTSVNSLEQQINQLDQPDLPERCRTLLQQLRLICQILPQLQQLVQAEAQERKQQAQP